MQDKVVVVVGATGGIAASVTQKLLSRDAKLVLAARDSQKLNALVSGLDLNAEKRTITVPCDITNYSQVENLMEEAIANFGKLDILINAAGAGIFKQYDRVTPEDLEAMLSVNLKGSFYTCQAAAKYMKEQKSGHICNIIGILGRHSMAMATAYCAAKFGVVGFSKCMADELKRYGIKFTLFYFGGVNTPFWDTVSLKVDRTKMLSAETAAEAIIFALSAEHQAVPMEINIQPESHLFF
ncbi:SDR family oxidoreductase [Floridanema evergladense]|uniref:SDR family oxidoreductase n=1 Tax=Floridaenema evergladense BLCC-F167 TaxID=3153639 RepID=A0ABV4WUU8_9CYAN